MRSTARETSSTPEVDPTADLRPPVHPGEVLFEEFLEPTGLSQYRLARDISVPPRRINEIVHGKRAITADTALRLARYFGTTPRFWLNLRAQYELDIESVRLGGTTPGAAARGCRRSLPRPVGFRPVAAPAAGGGARGPWSDQSRT